MTQYTLGQLAEQLGLAFEGDASLVVEGVFHPLQVKRPQQMALILDEKIVPMLPHLPIQTALVPEGLRIEGIPNQLKAPRPKVALAQLLQVFDKPAYVEAGIHSTAVIHPTAHIAPDVAIGPYCVVGPNATIGQGSRLISHVYVGQDAVMGEHCILHAAAYVGDRVVLGHRVILQAHASIGADGFSYVTPEKGSVEAAKSGGKIDAQNTDILRINSVGTVVLEDDVEVGANSCVDRATLGETRIGKGSKIDNLVQVGHNVTMGQNCLIVAHVGIAGSSKLEDRVVLAGQVGIPDHVTIGADAVIMPQSGVTKSVPAKSLLAGSPAMPYKEFLYKEMQIKRIKPLSDKVKALEAKLEALEHVSNTERQEQPV